MKPTSLSPEFYENLLNLIINYDFVPDNADDDRCTIDFEDVNGYFVSVVAVYNVQKYSDGEITAEFEDVFHISLTDEDGNDVTYLFDDKVFDKMLSK